MTVKKPERTHLSSKSLSMIGVPPKFHEMTMDHFMTYDEPDLVKAKNYIKNYLENLSVAFDSNRGMFLYGSNGVGKTFIACMIAKEAYRRRYTTRRTTFIEYISAYTKMWSAKGTEERDYLEQSFYNSYKAVEFLVLEEVGKEIDSKIATPILEDCLRYREDKGLVTIICTNLDVSKMKERYGASCFSLMQGNMIAMRIEGKDKRRDFFPHRRGEK